MLSPIPTSFKGISFPATQWGLVCQAKTLGSTDAKEAWAEIFSSYWFPLYAYLRSHGYRVHDAEDLTQGFFVMLMTRNSLSGVRQEKGRLRAYLLTVLKRYAASDWRKNRSLKRGGEMEKIPLDVAMAEKRLSHLESSNADPELEYNRKWAETLLEDSLKQVRLEMSETYGERVFQAIKPLLTRSRKVPYDELSRELCLSEAALRLIVHRARNRYRRVFKRRVLATLSDGEDLDEEMAYILSLFTT